MFKQPINQESQATIKSKSFAWEKRHWILVMGLVCLVFWYFAPSLKSLPLLQSVLNFLPTIGSLALATETILKLAF